MPTAFVSKAAANRSYITLGRISERSCLIDKITRFRREWVFVATMTGIHSKTRLPLISILHGLDLSFSSAHLIAATVLLELWTSKRSLSKPSVMSGWRLAPENSSDASIHSVTSDFNAFSSSTDVLGVIPQDLRHRLTSTVSTPTSSCIFSASITVLPFGAEYSWGARLLIDSIDLWCAS